MMLGRNNMRNGFKVYDTDTHVMPIAEVLEQYVDPSFRPRLLELAPYRVPAGKTADGTACHQYSVHRRFYRRLLGEAAACPPSLAGRRLAGAPGIPARGAG
jgi:hypothetical protein